MQSLKINKLIDGKQSPCYVWRQAYKDCLKYEEAGYKINCDIQEAQYYLCVDKIIKEKNHIVICN